jgi:NADPH2:quinone reductase
MRAIVVDGFGPPERLRVGEVAEPVPRPDEVLVMVHAAPVNYVDLLVVGGNYQFLPPLAFIPGKGPAGVVTALGWEVTMPATCPTKVVAMIVPVVSGIRPFPRTRLDTLI